MCFGSGLFCKQHASYPIKNPDVDDWLKSVKSDKHSTGPLPPVLPTPPVIKPNPNDINESPPSLVITTPTIVVESGDFLGTTIVDTPVEEVNGKAEEAKGIICKFRKIEGEQGQESINAHPVSVKIPAESSVADIVEKSIVNATAQTAGPSCGIKIITRNSDAAGWDTLNTHLVGSREEDAEEEPGSATFSKFSGDFTRDDSSNDGGESACSSPGISGHQVECAKKIEGTKAEPVAVEPIEMGVAKPLRKRADITSLDPGPVFSFSDVGEMEALDPASFHDMYTGSVWSGGVMTSDPGILLGRSGDYQRYGLEPPEDCIKDEEDTPELTYTADGMAIAPGLPERCVRLGEWKAHSGSQSYYPTPPSTPSYASTGKRPDHSGGGRHYWNGPGGRNYTPAALTSGSRWSHPSNTSILALNLYHSSPSHWYRTTRSS
ncbi:hypothetical protein B9Z19DRAFT_1068633 [Tuber borchii]|uniref:Uncharacterized protein n=1 Tax=Tuber borchii TaxID=42251 RepID=A0A2T6ZEH7_TUBBO|nr:hypothetical protein B9Z19DRAFT_1068633 [Tuber borchii]